MKGCCRHCGRPRAHRRGLCYRCYSDQTIRGAYETLYKQDFERAAPLPAEPTAAIPGTEQKILVLIGRESRTEALHHPEDRNVFPGLAGGGVGGSDLSDPADRPAQLAFAPGPPPEASDDWEAAEMAECG